MNSNQATLEKLERMGLRGMARAMRTTLEASPAGRLEPEELVSNLVDAEWDDRRARKLSRLLKGARFRYRAGVEDILGWRAEAIARNDVLLPLPTSPVMTVTREEARA